MSGICKHVAGAPPPLLIVLVDRGGRARLRLFRDLKDTFTLQRWFLLGVINFNRVQLLEFLSLDEAALVTEPLVCKVLTAAVSHFLVAVSIGFLCPVSDNLSVSPIVWLFRTRAWGDIPRAVSMHWWLTRLIKTRSFRCSLKFFNFHRLSSGRNRNWVGPCRCNAL